ncbi:TolC family protein [Magnetospirillum sulfuroxidans]|nr:TolC family protein [Magnetospirillum sulfuroxidans]
MTDELQLLLDSHPMIKAKNNVVAGSAEAIAAARAGYLPTVKLTGDAGPEYVNSPTRRNTEGEAFFKGRETVGLVVTQRLFDGYATDSAVESAKLAEAYYTSDLRSTRQSTLLSGIRAYLNVLRFNRLIQLARENERKVQDQMHLEDERVIKGSGVAGDVLAAKQRLQMAKEARVDFEGQYSIWTATYQQLYGHAPTVGGFSDPPLPASLLPGELTEAVIQAERNNPMVEMSGKGVALADERRRGAEAGYYPNVDLIGRANYENDKNATLGVRRDWSLLLTATWEIFSGFKTQAQVAQAGYQQAAARDGRDYAGRAASEMARIAWHTLSSARQRTILLENAAIMAEEVWDNARRRQEGGNATVRDVLDEEMRINDARIKHANAYYDMILAGYMLLSAMGELELENISQVANHPGAADQLTSPATLSALPR